MLPQQQSYIHVNLLCKHLCLLTSIAFWEKSQLRKRELSDIAKRNDLESTLEERSVWATKFIMSYSDRRKGRRYSYLHKHNSESLTILYKLKATWVSSCGLLKLQRRRIKTYEQCPAQIFFISPHPFIFLLADLSCRRSRQTYFE